MRLALLTPASLASLLLVACATAAPFPPPPSSPAEIVVQRQLEAYNAHDVDAFAATYAPDIELFDLPDLNCNVARRIADGAFVVDHEVCDLGLPDSPEMRAIAIYQVEDGLIRRVWFAPAD